MDDDELKTCYICNRKGKRLVGCRNLYCHSCCLYFSTKLQQHYSDSAGGSLLGFSNRDIRRVVEKAAQRRCFYCKKPGASIQCSRSKCDRWYHHPCGVEAHGTFYFFLDFRSFCSRHRTHTKWLNTVCSSERSRLSLNVEIDSDQQKQQLGEDNDAPAEKKRNTMGNANNGRKRPPLRRRSLLNTPSPKIQRPQRACKKSATKVEDHKSIVETKGACVCCFEEITVTAENRYLVYRTKCCNGALLHIECAREMAAAAALNTKCPNCGDREIHNMQLCYLGVEIPISDSTWEISNQFEDLAPHDLKCTAIECVAPDGRQHFDVDDPKWQVLQCRTCGGNEAHPACLDSIDDFAYKDGKLLCEICKLAYKESNADRIATQGASPSNVGVRDAPVDQRGECSSSHIRHLQTIASDDEKLPVVSGGALRQVKRKRSSENDKDPRIRRLKEMSSRIQPKRFSRSTDHCSR